MSKRQICEGDVLLCKKTGKCLYEGFFYIVTKVDEDEKRVHIKRSDKISEPFHMKITGDAFREYFKYVDRDKI